MKNFKIRQETKEDLDEVYQLIKTAFETAKVKDGDEQDFAVKLREGKNFIPELSMVAETDGKADRSYNDDPNSGFTKQWRTIYSIIGSSIIRAIRV